MNTIRTKRRKNACVFYCTETLQLDDYSKYVSDMFDENSRIRRRNEVFPKQLLDLYELGEGLLS